MRREKRQVSWIEIFYPDGVAVSNNNNTDNNRNDNVIASLQDLKQTARNYLPQNSVLKRLILSEPDVLDKEKALAKTEIFLRLLYEELA